MIAGVGMTGGALVFGSFEAALPVFVGSVIGTIVTPDYDLNANLPHSILTDIPIFGRLWKGMWRPYQEIVGHRSFFSHFPVVGTGGRALYMGAWISLFVWIFSSLGYGPDVRAFWDSWDKQFWTAVFIIWCAQDIVHFLLDL